MCIIHILTTCWWQFIPVSLYTQQHRIIVGHMVARHAAKMGLCCYPISGVTDKSTYRWLQTGTQCCQMQGYLSFQSLFSHLHNFYSANTQGQHLYTDF